MKIAVPWPAPGSAVRRRLAELLGAALIAASAAMLLALASFDSLDPSFNRAADGPIHNWLGAAGAYAADLLLQTMGLASVLLAVLIAGWGSRMVAGRGIARPWLRVTLLPIFLAAGAATLSAFPAQESWPLGSGLGGMAGKILLGAILERAREFGAPTDAATLAAAGSALTFVVGIAALGFTVSEWRGLFQNAGLALGHGVAAARWLGAGLRAVAARMSPGGAPPRSKREPALRRERKEAVARRRASAGLVEQPRASAAPAARRGTRARQGTLDLLPSDEYQLPGLDLLEPPPAHSHGADVDEDALAANARLLESVLEDFGIRGEIVKIRPGPVVALYELEPAPGTKTSRVIGLADDIARSMSAVSARVAVVPGRNVIGIELPNAVRETVYLRDLLASHPYERTAAELALVLGKDIGGQPVIVDLARMPHLLVAGTTGSGKSVAINAMILSLLFRMPPDRCKFIMIDPKMLELSVYEGIPHLIAPVVTEPTKAIVALKWTVREMESRYRSMSQLGVRNIAGYNARVAEARARGEVLSRKVQTGFDAETGRPVYEDQPLNLDPLPLIVVVVDEMADLMLVAGKDIEAAIQRLSQMARAAGIHLIMATQRPSVDVITGTIKANFPTRVSFQVTSRIDSRTILGDQGAEQLLGHGDMLYMAAGGRITRIHGPLVRDHEVEAVVDFLKGQGQPTYIEAVTEEDDTPALDGGSDGSSGDDLYDQAVALVAREGKASTSFIQRHLQIGYNRAARIVERMEQEGVVSRADRVGRREVLIRDASELAS
ncbi:MAG: DNA translocase FtsK 4TM domain-containing protein [Alphaproteobacteria bacterium]